ncbi:MAG: GIY-YIG nuclease family protein [Thermoplasmata archaeon]|nr:MAG: GIY-YIG nuclease family protein [Thermoplasmata archaeon]
MKGTYILLMFLNLDKSIRIGKLGDMQFRNGWYVYIGSALNSLEGRIKRHLRSEKKHYWHIDFFLDHAKIKNVFFKEGTVKEECNVAHSFLESFDMVPNFGCSDCSCKSHLYVGEKISFESIIENLQFEEFLQ